MLPDGVEDRVRLWIESGKGFKTARDSNLRDSVFDRGDVPQSLLITKMERGDKTQSLRLRYAPSIDVDYNNLFAGKIEASLEEAEDMLQEMGYRNNPTAYVEVTDDYGPDDGSYARQFVTETQAEIDRKYITHFPNPFKRIKRQVHVCLWEVENEVHLLAHEERSAWLQPMLHVKIPDSKARVGVQLLRIDWYNEFGEELGGRENVRWSTAH